MELQHLPAAWEMSEIVGKQWKTHRASGTRRTMRLYEKMGDPWSCPHAAREPHRDNRQLNLAGCTDSWDAWNQWRWWVGCKSNAALDASLQTRPSTSGPLVCGALSERRWDFGGAWESSITVWAQSLLEEGIHDLKILKRRCSCKNIPWGKAVMQKEICPSSTHVRLRCYHVSRALLTWCYLTKPTP